MRVFFKLVLFILVIAFIVGSALAYIYINDIKSSDFNRRIIKSEKLDEPDNLKEQTSIVELDARHDSDNKKSDDNDNKGIKIDNDDNKKNEDSLYLSLEELNYFKKISLSDRLKLLELVSKLKKSDLQAFYRMSSGGITYKEMEILKEMLLSTLEAKDLDVLEDIIDNNKKHYTAWKENQE